MSYKLARRMLDIKMMGLKQFKAMLIMENPRYT